ncbi:MAG TPA: 30S ribosomal protein S4 [Polyangia bacterium]|jgi:small subunit ribosomal protein S4
MSHYLAPRLRILRRLGVPLSGLTRKSIERRPYPPGQHGPTRRRRPSEYALQLAEKQKVRFYYGLSEGQLHTAVRRAASRPGPTGGNLLQALESRLDNVVFRLGVAPTIVAARQLVRHGHVEVNGRRVDMPSFALRRGMTVAVRPKSRAHQLVAEGVLRGPELPLPSYLERAPDGFSGRLTGTPARDDVPVPLDETLVVEFYAR